MAIPLVVSIVGETKSLERGLDKAGDEATRFGKRFDAGTLFKVAAFAGVATIAVDGLAQLGRAAADDALEADKLATAIEAAGAATGDWAAQVDNAIARGQDLAFTDTQVRDALTPLVGVLGDVGAATDALALAQDVARLKGVDLATAADAVAKAEDGSAGALAKLLKISAEGKTSAEVLAEAQRLAAGQADLYGDSQAGAADKAKIKWDELGEKLGTVVAPILDTFIGLLNDLFDWLDQIGGEGGAAAALGRGFDKVRPALDLFVGALKIVGSWLAAVIAWVGQLVDDLATLIDQLANFRLSLDASDVGFDFEGLVRGPGLAPGMAGTTGGPGSSSSTTIHVHAGGQDPETIIRAIRRWAATNGGAGGFTREINGDG